MELSEGEPELIGVFREGERVFVVLSHEVSAVSLDGEVLATWLQSKRITAAAWSGTRLAIADEFTLSLLDEDLTLQGTAPLEQPCGAVAFTSGPRLVCVEKDNQDRDYYVFDGLDATPIASTEVQDNTGLGLFSLAGTSDLITVSWSNYPPFINLLRVTESGEVLRVGSSIATKVHPMSLVAAVDASPPGTITFHSGFRYEVMGPGCAPELGMDSTCFPPVGPLGEPGGGRKYFGMASHGPNTFFGLYNGVASNHEAHPETRRCENGCVLQRVDVDTGEATDLAVFGELVYFGAFIVPDADGLGAIVGYNRDLPYIDDPPKHRVVHLRF